MGTTIALTEEQRAPLAQLLTDITEGAGGAVLYAPGMFPNIARIIFVDVAGARHIITSDGTSRRLREDELSFPLKVNASKHTPGAA